MCGIAGYISFKNSELPEFADLEKMSDSISYRGPDAEGFWTNENVGLAHRRLSIIELSELGKQPMDCGLNTVIVFNGEIYNYLEIKSELESLGRKFISRSDTEVILHSYDEWGTDCVHKFNGMFAFAIYHKEKKTLFVARDRVGVKPLFYFFNGKHFVFGSELKPIIKYPFFKKMINQEAVEHFFAYKYVRSPLSIFEEVSKLQPGHHLLLKDGKIELTQYWNPLSFVNSGLKSAKPTEEYEHEFGRLIQESVKYRMISDVPLGALLSGGIDSSLIVNEMVKQSKKVSTFTVGFEDKRYDESGYAKKIAGILGTDHHELILSASDLLNTITTLTDHYDEPFADPSSLPTYLVSKLARKYVTVALSGDGGDELFWGYSRYRKYQSAMNFKNVPYFVRNLGGKLVNLIPHDKLQKAGQGISFKSPEDCYNYLNGIFKGSHLNQLFNYPIKNPSLVSMELRNLKQPNLLLQPSLVDFQSYLPDDVLTKVDRASMAVSLEARNPLLDYRLVEFALNLPFDMKFREGTQKYLMKQHLFKDLDESLFNRPKQGFDLPLNHWFRHDLKDLIQTQLSENQLLRFGFINAKFATKIINDHLSGKHDYYYMIWALLSFDMWYRKFYEN